MLVKIKVLDYRSIHYYATFQKQGVIQTQRVNMQHFRAYKTLSLEIRPKLVFGQVIML